MPSLIQFHPLYQTRVWGGRQMQELLGRDLPADAQPYGESWELSDRAEALSLVASPGPYTGLSLHDLWTDHREAVFGAALEIHPAERFPLLMKILDACQDLSIQVHPPATVAEQLRGEPKTECWFIVQADPGAKLYVGLKPGVSAASFRSALEAGTVPDQVHVIEPVAGDFLFIPSGRLHAIGAGLVIYEIQQNSDTTYRVFDWNRLGLDGQPRQLHIDESLASIDFNDFAPALSHPSVGTVLADCEHFRLTLDAATPGRVIGNTGTSATLVITQGTLTLDGVELKAGDFALLPAFADEAARRIETASADAQFLNVTLPAAV